MEAFTPQMRGALKSRWGEGGESAEEKKKAALQKALLEIGTKTAEGGGLRVYQEDDPTTMTPGATVLREEFGPGALDMWSGLSDVNRQKNEQEQAKSVAELNRTRAEQQLKVFDKTVKAFDYLEKIDKQEGASPDAKKELRKTFLAAAKMSGIDLSQHEFDNIAQLKEAWQVEQGNKISELFQAWKEDRTTLNESVFLAMLSRAKGVVDTEVWKTAYNLAKQKKPVQAGEKEREYKAKITTLQKEYPDLSSQEASGIILGTIKVMADEVSGTRYLVDTVKGTEKPLVAANGQQRQARPEQASEKTIWELAEHGTGVMSAAKAAGSFVTGTVGLPVAEETLYARQYIQGTQNDLIRALSINPRFPVGEINRLKEEINISPILFDSPAQMKVRAKAIDTYLRQRIEKEERASVDTKLSITSRQAARSAANDIGNYLKILGVPKQIKTSEEYESLPEGAVYIAPDGTERKKGAR